MKSSFASPWLLAAAGLASASCFSDRCSSLAGKLVQQLDDTTIESTTFVEAGTQLFEPVRHESCTPLNQTADFDFCRVELTAHTGPESEVLMEAWLPLNWTGRYMTTGNGGLGGCIDYRGLTYGGSRGFAVVGTNNGHDGNLGLPFYKNPGVVKDYVYRAIHVGTQIGKQITQAMYGKEHAKSYFLGCSTGGRQGFQEAQDFPDDFDGIIAGAPAFAFTGLQIASGLQYTFVGPKESSTFLTPDEWGLVINDTLAQCDHLDGHVDTVIEDPDLCQYRPERLLCASGQTEGCLTPPQVGALRKIFAPVYDANGQLLYPRQTPGVDSSGILWSGQPAAYATDWWRYVVYQDPSFDGNFSVKDIQPALDVESYGIDAFDGDLSAVRDRGAKILHYHGLQDGAISSDNSARYYNHVSRTMGLPSEELDEFYRYFRISGMAHCDGGTGAFNIGNRLTNLPEEGDEDLLTAMVKWVEDGEAPEYILGTAFADELRGDVKFKRRHCRYPRRGVYVEGDPDSADSWQCQ